MQSVDYTFQKLQKVGKVVSSVFTTIWIKSRTRGGERRQTKFTDQSNRPIPIPNQSWFFFLDRWEGFVKIAPNLDWFY